MRLVQSFAAHQIHATAHAPLVVVKLTRMRCIEARCRVYDAEPLLSGLNDRFYMSKWAVVFRGLIAADHEEQAEPAKLWVHRKRLMRCALFLAKWPLPLVLAIL